MPFASLLVCTKSIWLKQPISILIWLKSEHNDCDLSLTFIFQEMALLNSDLMNNLGPLQGLFSVESSREFYIAFTLAIFEPNTYIRQILFGQSALGGSFNPFYRINQIKHLLRKVSCKRFLPSLVLIKSKSIYQCFIEDNFIPF